MDKAKQKNFWVRTLSGVVLLVVVVAAVLVSQWTFGLLLAAICVGSMWEFYGLAEKKGAEPNKWLGIAGGMCLLTAIFAMSVMEANDDNYVPWLFIPLLVAFFMSCLGIFIAELYRNRENPFSNIGITLTGIFYIALPLALFSFISIFSLSDISVYSPWLVMTYIFIIWMNDIGAYLVGVSIGKHRLFERISPKKSWEGFFGGVVFGVGTAVAAAYIMGWNVWFWVGLAVVAVVSGVFGDLLESMFKRSAGVKDSGNLIPGHGGMLDRFDALIFSLPFVFVYFIIFAISHEN